MADEGSVMEGTQDDRYGLSEDMRVVDLTTGRGVPLAETAAALNEVVRLRSQLAGAIGDLAEAVRLLDNARCDLHDPALRGTWARRRKALRMKWER